MLAFGRFAIIMLPGRGGNIMNSKKIASAIVITTLLLSGCASQKTDTGSTAMQGITGSSSSQPTVISEVSDITADTAPAQVEAGYRYNPHPYSSIVALAVPQDYWDSLYNLSDALRVGADTFECSSQEAYEWCMNESFISVFIPAACLRVTGESTDGSTPYENGVGRIYYKMPVDEFVTREAEFETLVEDILNTNLEADDDDFEKCLKLYDYMESNYDYNHDLDTEEELKSNDGYVYTALHNHLGKCIDLSSVYAFLLNQAGVEAVEVGCFADNMDHSWDYVIINGEGYFIDPTWALKSTRDSDFLLLDYFMMTSEKREVTGCPVDDLTMQLCPKFWIESTPIRVPATDTSLDFGYQSVLARLDEENKIVYYYDADGLEQSVSYGSIG